MNAPERRDLICLHLLAHDEGRERSPAPVSVTAAGIGDALELGETATDRVRLLDELSSLQQDGLITAAERPVVGRETPRPVYSLTDNGETYASEFRESVSDWRVTLINGTEREVPLSEVNRFVDSETPMVTALARMTEDRSVPLVESVGARFVDREASMETVRDAIESSFTQDSRTVIVEGASGLGKTALVQEAVDDLRRDHESLVLAKGTSPAGTSNPYNAIREAFESIPDDGALLDRLMEAKMGFTPDEPDDVAAQRKALFNDLAEGLRDAAADQPIVIFLDNLQWADEATLDLFVHLATSLSDWLSRVAFVGTYRPDSVVGGDHILTEKLDELDDAVGYTDVRLGPLGQEDTGAMLAGIIGDQQLPSGFVELVHEQTGGNPLFVRETAVHLLEAGLVDPAEAVYPTSQSEVDLPQEVAEQIDERLMSLDDNSRELLRLGAVAGERVPAPVLAEAADLPPERRREYEDVLVASRIWEQTGPEIQAATHPSDETDVIADGGSDYQFVSGGLQEAVVDRLPETLARRYHARIAEAFESVYAESIEEQAARIGYHYQEAGEPGEAFEYYRRAGDHAQNTYANDDAIHNYQQALAIGQREEVAGANELASLAHQIADVQRRIGEYEAALETIDEGLSVAEEGTREQCELLGDRVLVKSRMGAYDEAREVADRQRDLAADLGAKDLEGEALGRAGTAAFRQADYDQASEYQEAALEAFEAADDTAGMAEAHKSLGNLATVRRDNEAARAHYEEARARFEKLGDRRGVASVESNLHILAGRDGQREQSIAHLENALSEFEAIGARPDIAHMQLNLGVRFGEDGRYGEAIDLLEDAQATFESIGARHYYAHTFAALGNIAKQRGEYEQARQQFETALAEYRELGNEAHIADVYFSLAGLARVEGRIPAARAYYQMALVYNHAADDTLDIARSHNKLGQVAQQVGDFDRAHEYLDRARAHFDTVDEPLGFAWTDLFRGRLLHEQGDLDRAEELLRSARQDLETHAQHERYDVARAQVPLARLELERGAVESARTRAKEARSTFEELGIPLWKARSQLLLGRIAAATDDVNDATAYWEAALETFRRIGVPDDALTSVRLLVESSRTQGDDERASEWVDVAQSLVNEAPETVAARHRDWIETHAAELDLTSE